MVLIKSVDIKCFSAILFSYLTIKVDTKYSWTAQLAVIDIFTLVVN